MGRIPDGGFCCRLWLGLFASFDRGDKLSRKISTSTFQLAVITLAMLPATAFKIFGNGRAGIKVQPAIFYQRTHNKGCNSSSGCGDFLGFEHEI